MPVDISVIIPTFRRPRELIEAVRSALSQPRVSVEVLVLDDSPEGSARPVIESLADPRVTYRKMPEPSGGKPALVRNTGWRMATGRYVHFLDDDDRAAEGAYADLVADLDARPKVGVAFGRVEPFGDDPRELQHQQTFFASAARRARRCQQLGLSRLMVTNILFKDALFVNSACIVRRTCIEPLGGYDPDCIIFEDIEFYLRAIRRFGGRFVDRLVLHRRTGASSLVHDLETNDPIAVAYRYMCAKYGREHGPRELLAHKLIARTALRWF